MRGDLPTQQTIYPDFFLLKMNSIARFSRFSITVAKRASVSRTFVTSAKACGGAKHDAHGDGHDDHEHHEHPVSCDANFCGIFLNDNSFGFI